MRVDNGFKIYANGCYCEADRNEDDLWVIGMGKMGFFPDLEIPILRFDPTMGDEVRRFPVEVLLRREGTHPIKAFGWPERVLVAEKGEFRHTVLGTHHFDMIFGK